MSHIVESCPLTKLNGSLSRLHSADEDAVLTSYGSWNAYEKKKDVRGAVWLYATQIDTDIVILFPASTTTSCSDRTSWLSLLPARRLCVCQSFICSVVLSVSRITEKKNRPISLKLDVVIGPTSRKKWLTFGSDPIPDTDMMMMMMVMMVMKTIT